MDELDRHEAKFGVRVAAAAEQKVKSGLKFRSVLVDFFIFVHSVPSDISLIFTLCHLVSITTRCVCFSNLNGAWKMKGRRSGLHEVRRELEADSRVGRLAFHFRPLKRENCLMRDYLFLQ